jgi:archaellin
MKIPKEYTINYIVHAISILDIQLLTEVLNLTPRNGKDKIDIAHIIFRYKMNVETVFDLNDTYFEVINENKNEDASCSSIYTFTANTSRLSFTLQIQQDDEGMITIKDHILENSNKPEKHILFFGEEEEAPF